MKAIKRLLAQLESADVCVKLARHADRDYSRLEEQLKQYKLVARNNLCNYARLLLYLREQPTTKEIAEDQMRQSFVDWNEVRRCAKI
jgi:hypothetical protein